LRELSLEIVQQIIKIIFRSSFEIVKHILQLVEVVQVLHLLLLLLIGSSFLDGSLGHRSDRCRYHTLRDRTGSYPLEALVAVKALSSSFSTRGCSIVSLAIFCFDAVKEGHRRRLLGLAMTETCRRYLILEVLRGSSHGHRVACLHRRFSYDLLCFWEHVAGEPYTTMIKLEMRNPAAVMQRLTGLPLLLAELAVIDWQQPRLRLVLEVLAELHHHNPGVRFLDQPLELWVLNHT
jgi:hypothetical protein